MVASAWSNGIQPKFGVRPIREELTVAFCAVHYEDFGFAADFSEGFFELACAAVPGIW